MEKDTDPTQAEPFPPAPADAAPSATGVAEDADELDEAKPGPTERS